MDVWGHQGSVKRAKRAKNPLQGHKRLQHKQPRRDIILPTLAKTPHQPKTHRTTERSSGAKADGAGQPRKCIKQTHPRRHASRSYFAAAWKQRPSLNTKQTPQRGSDYKHREEATTRRPKGVFSQAHEKGRGRYRGTKRHGQTFNNKEPKTKISILRHGKRRGHGNAHGNREKPTAAKKRANAAFIQPLRLRASQTSRPQRLFLSHNKGNL